MAKVFYCLGFESARNSIIAPKGLKAIKFLVKATAAKVIRIVVLVVQLQEQQEEVSPPPVQGSFQKVGLESQYL